MQIHFDFHADDSHSIDTKREREKERERESKRRGKKNLDKLNTKKKPYLHSH